MSITHSVFFRSTAWSAAGASLLVLAETRAATAERAWNVLMMSVNDLRPQLGYYGCGHDLPSNLRLGFHLQPVANLPDGRMPVGHHPQPRFAPAFP